MADLEHILSANAYPGRGIVTGLGPGGQFAFIAYFIMGRSENSRNRVFTEKQGGIVTEAANPAKLADPSLVIYAPVRLAGQHTVVTNGDQTDTIVQALKQEGQFAQTAAEHAFEAALRTRTFEPDPPIYTPRISALVTGGQGGFSYKMSILKSAGAGAAGAQRFFWEYAQPQAGKGHFVHTYSGREAGGALESFMGEPVCVDIPADADAFGSGLWQALNSENKVALFVRAIYAGGGQYTKIYNQYKKTQG